MKLFLVAVTLVVINYVEGHILLRSGNKAVDLYFPECVGKTLEETKLILDEKLPGVCIKEFTRPMVSEFYYGCVGIVVEDDLVSNPPHYINQEPIIEDFEKYVGLPYENMIEAVKVDHHDYKYQILYHGTVVYADDHDGQNYVEIQVDEAGNVQDSKPVWRY